MEANKSASAVVHYILTDTYHILKKGTSYRELGADYSNRLQHARIRRFHVKCLRDLGNKVVLGERKVAERALFSEQNLVGAGLTLAARD